ncbi:MAG: LD-carboxypeptidase [Cyanobacteriota bacterium]|nr:LD-carboxypeptidase [Cyanobacteriota bacterium]
MQFPPPLQPGDLLKIVSPSGRLRELGAFEKGLEIWRSRGYRLEFTDSWKACEGYLAGTDKQRRQALAQAWFDPQCKGILCARGGYGSARLLENWRWREFERNGKIAKKNDELKWLIGFSDITGLLWSLAKAGMGGIHGPLLTTLASEPEWSLHRLFDCLEGRPLAPLQGKGWGGGTARGLLLPANLTVATHLLGTSAQPPLERAIVAFEDVGEAPYRIDRMLTHWRMLEAFQGVVGIALGRFSHCDVAPGISSWTVEEVLRDRLGDLGVPIVSSLPFGHDGVNAALPVGQWAELDGDRGQLTIMDR